MRLFARPRRNCGRFRKQGLFRALALRLRLRRSRIRRNTVGQNLGEYAREGTALVTGSEVIDVKCNCGRFLFAVALAGNTSCRVLGLDLDLRNQAGALRRVFLEGERNKNMHCDANTRNTHLRNNVVRRININDLLRKSLWENGRCVIALELGAIWMHTPALESANRTTRFAGRLVLTEIDLLVKLLRAINAIRICKY